MTQYFGDNAITGSTASGGNLTLSSTLHATKGSILFGTSAYDEVNNRLGLITTAPTHTLTQSSTSTGYAHYNTADQTTNIERATFTWSANTFQLATSQAGSGSARPIYIRSAGSASAREIRVSATSDTTAQFDFVTTAAVATAGGVFAAIRQNTSASSGISTDLQLNPTIAQSSTAGYNVLLINPTESSTGSGAKNLILAQAGSDTKFGVDNTGIVSIKTGLVPIASDGAAIGTTTLMWSDLFLASGAVINFNNGNSTITHSAGLLTSNVDIAVPDEAYGSGWNASLEVPTKNAVYDKIETLQPLDATLTALAGISTAANKMITITGTDTFSTTDFEDHALATYAGTFTWNSTPPSTIVSQQYAWSRIGGLVTVDISVFYSSAGTTNTTCIVTLPSDCPSPVVIAGAGDAASEFMYPINGGRVEGNMTGNPTAVRGGLRRNAADNGYEVLMIFGSVSATHLQLRFSYRVS